MKITKMPGESKCQCLLQDFMDKTYDVVKRP